MRNLASYSKETVYKWWALIRKVYGDTPVYSLAQFTNDYNFYLTLDRQGGITGLFGKNGMIAYMINARNYPKVMPIPIMDQLAIWTNGFNPVFIGVALVGGYFVFQFKPIKRFVKKIF